MFFDRSEGAEVRRTAPGWDTGNLTFLQENPVCRRSRMPQ